MVILLIFCQFWNVLKYLKFLKYLQNAGKHWKKRKLVANNFEAGWLAETYRYIPTSTPRVFHVKTTRKRLFLRHFNVQYTWCVCRDAGTYKIFRETKIQRSKWNVYPTEDMYIEQNFLKLNQRKKLSFSNSST